MKELSLEKKAVIELSVKKQQQVEYELVNNIIPHNGHVVWQINNETLEIEKAKFSNATYHLGGINKKEIIIKKGHSYVAALNKRNALEKFKQGKNGSKSIIDEPLPMFDLNSEE